MTKLERYIIARWCYAIGEDFIGDIEYQQLEASLKETMPDNEYINRSWSDDPCPLELLEKYDMMHLYRDIKFDHKSESMPSINSETEFEALFRHLNERSRLSFKHDGFNIPVNYYNGEPISAETRGRTGNSLNANIITKMVPKKIPIMGKVKVTGELTIPNSKWDKFKLMTGNTSQRNSVATVLANDMLEYAAFSAFNVQCSDYEIKEDIYELLMKWGFNVPMYKYVENYEQLCSAMRYFKRINAGYDYPNDGLVIENSNCQYALRVGAWKEECMQSYVMGYEERVGLYGVAMSVAIKPVVYGGSTKRNVNVTNLQYIIDSDLKIGSPIAFDNRAMTTSVLNVNRTEELHRQYAGHFDKYRDMIDKLAEKQNV